MEIQKQIRNILSVLPEGVRLIAVSKTKSAEAILDAYQGGQRAFGENRPQEMMAKYRELPKDIEWHMIGQLQEKNVKYIAPFVTLIHSVDSLRLLIKIDKEAAKQDRVIDCLLEFHIAQEPTKAGLCYEAAEEILKSEVYRQMQHIRIVGVMGIATFTDNESLIRQEFHQLKEYFFRLKQCFFKEEPMFRELSMGMSEDYRIAIEEGATMVRIGSAIFGKRIYGLK